LARKEYRIITLADPDYPRLLCEIPDPPPYLYVSGRLDSSALKIAVVGSRNATGYGLTTTKNLCADLVSLGITIVSGMARGIDTAAHEGAMMGGGKTIAVLGSGLERIYPAENAKLFHRISENGAVVSEFALLTEPEGHNFPLRNRIISGMSLGTVVVEATKKSGSLITARLAAEQNREVFAVPGSIQSFKSTGTHTLIKQGAKLVEHAQDIVEELAPFIETHDGTGNIAPDEDENIPAFLSSEETQIFKLLEPYPIHIDSLARKLSIEPGKLSSMLLTLELKGLVRQLPGKFFILSEKPRQR
jgi:DNA processing protein